MRPDEKHGRNWRKLGRHFTREQPRHKLVLEDYLYLEDIPVEVSLLPPILSSDTVGDSAAASAAHMLNTIRPFQVVLSGEEVLEVYKAMTGFDPTLLEE
jgi:hypothetical protein